MGRQYIIKRHHRHYFMGLIFVKEQVCMQYTESCTQKGLSWNVICVCTNMNRIQAIEVSLLQATEVIKNKITNKSWKIGPFWDLWRDRWIRLEVCFWSTFLQAHFSTVILSLPNLTLYNKYFQVQLKVRSHTYS